MDCKEPKCVEELKKCAEEDAICPGLSYAEGGYDTVHCEVENCHTIYLKGKNGNTCENCGKELCEDCSSGHGTWDDEDYYCSDCN